MNALWKRVRSRFRKHVSIPLFSAQGRDDPYPYYKELRETAPVHCLRKENIWTVSRYDDVQHVLTQPDLYLSSELGGIENSLLGADGPDHLRVRKIVSRLFAPSRLQSLENSVRVRAREYVDRMAERGDCELMTDLARPLPIQVITTVLDFDPERWQEYSRWSDAAAIDGTECPDDAARVLRQRCLDEMNSFLADHLTECRAGRRNGFCSTEVIPELTDKEALDVLRLLLVAGHITTAFLLGNIVVALLRNPGVMKSLRADPTLIPSAVEETLRINTPGLSAARRAAKDVTLGGQRIKKDSVIFALLASANHSEEKFVKPDLFQLDRDTQPHVGFGAGVHFCVGAPLSRLEARVTTEELLDRLEVIEAVEPINEIEWEENMHLRGPKRLKVHVQAFQ